MKKSLPIILVIFLLSLPTALLAKETVLNGTYSGRHVLNKGKGPYIVEGNVRFDADSNVKINPGTKFLIKADSYIVFFGKVQIKSNADNRVTFTSAVESPHYTDNNTVYFYGNQNLEVSYVQFDSIMRVYFYDCPNMTLRNNYFKNLGRTTYIFSCDGLIDNNRFWHTDDWHDRTRYPYGFLVHSETGKCTITNNEFYNLRSGPVDIVHGHINGVGIIARNSHNLEIAYNTFQNVASAGIALRNIDYTKMEKYSIQIHHNTITNVCNGISVYEDDNYLGYMSNPDQIMKINDNTINQSPYAPEQPWANFRIGIEIGQANAEVVNNTLICSDDEENHTMGLIVMGDSILKIENNTISGYDQGFDINLTPNFYLWDDLVPSKYTIKHNTVNCQTGVYIWSDPGVDLNSNDRVFTENNFINCEIPIHSSLVNGEHLEDFSNNYWCGLSLEEIPEHLINGTLILNPIALIPFVF